jgi:hypothetical protein
MLLKEPTHSPAPRLWPKIQIFLPISTFTLVCSAEMTTVRYFETDPPLHLLPLLALALVVPLVPLCVITFTAFRRPAFRRSLEIMPEGLILHRQPPNPLISREINFTPPPVSILHPLPSSACIPWDRVTKLHLHPPQRPSGKTPSGKIPTASLRIEYIPWPPFRFLQKTFTLPGRITIRPGGRTRFQQFLDQPAQTDLLRHELDELRQLGHPIPPLKVKTDSLSVARLWIAMLGLLFFYHGFPLLILGLQQVPAHPPSDDLSYGTHLGAKTGAKLGPILARHFHSLQAFHRFFLFTGAFLTLAAAILILIAFRPRRQILKPISDPN